MSHFNYGGTLTAPIVLARPGYRLARRRLLFIDGFFDCISFAHELSIVLVTLARKPTFTMRTEEVRATLQVVWQFRVLHLLVA